MQSDTTLYFIQLYYNSSYMFRPNCRVIFRLIFRQVECTIDNASIYEISYYKKWLKWRNILYNKLRIKILNVVLYTIDFKNHIK